MTYEITDTFGGEANYCWVKRGELAARTRLGAVRKVKRLARLTGVRCEVFDFGDSLEIRPVGKHAPCVVAFVNW